VLAKLLEVTVQAGLAGDRAVLVRRGHSGSSQS
jgi:hypothetical protein